MTRGPIDLHTHCSVSDGTETPTQLIRAAVEAGIDTVAITDHDSTAGWDEALTAAGIESQYVEFPGRGHSFRNGFDASVFFDFWLAH